MFTLVAILLIPMVVAFIVLTLRFSSTPDYLTCQLTMLGFVPTDVVEATLNQPSDGTHVEIEYQTDPR